MENPSCSSNYAWNNILKNANLILRVLCCWDEGPKSDPHSPSSSFSPVHSLNSNHPSASDKIHSILPPARCPWDSQCLQSFLLSTFLYEPAYFSYCCPDWMVTPRNLPRSPKTCCYTFSQQLVFFLHCPIRIITNLFICAILLSSSLSQ